MRFRRFRAVGVVWLAAVGALLPSGMAGAQEPPPPGQESPPMVVGGEQNRGGEPNDPFGQPEKLPPVRSPGIVTRPPYVSWKAHSGTAAESVALLRVGTPDGPASTGLVLRCDGFILVPNAVIEARRSGTAVFVTLTGAENEQITAPIPVTSHIHNVSPRCPFGVLKINDHHVRS
jgi:hypothetical protein